MPVQVAKKRQRNGTERVVLVGWEARATLAERKGKGKHAVQKSCVVGNWRPQLDSNQRPIA